MGARYASVMMLRRVQAMMQALNGGIDREGGWIMSGEFHHSGQTMAGQAVGVNMDSQLANMAGLDLPNLVIGALSRRISPRPSRIHLGLRSTAEEAGKPGLHSGNGRRGAEGVCGRQAQLEGTTLQTRAMFINAANPVQHYYPDTYWKEMMQHENMELVVLDAPFRHHPYADVILPNSTYWNGTNRRSTATESIQDLAITTLRGHRSLYDSWESPMCCCG